MHLITSFPFILSMSADNFQLCSRVETISGQKAKVASASCHRIEHGVRGPWIESQREKERGRRRERERREREYSAKLLPAAALFRCLYGDLLSLNYFADWTLVNSLKSYNTLSLSLSLSPLFLSFSLLLFLSFLSVFFLLFLSFSLSFSVSFSLSLSFSVSLSRSLSLSLSLSFSLELHFITEQIYPTVFFYPAAALCHLIMSVDLCLSTSFSYSNFSPGGLVCSLEIARGTLAYLRRD
jgi:hypothetical protein